MSSPDLFLTIPEIAEVLRCSPDTVRRLVRRREIAAVNFGTGNQSYRVRTSEVERFIGARTIPALTPTRSTRTAS